MNTATQRQGHLTACRHCGGENLAPFCDLGMQPPSNFNLKPEQLVQPEVYMPLRAVVCPDCWLVQLDYFEASDALFNDDYAYFSSFSSSWLAHAAAYAEERIAAMGLGADSLVAEIASNDGYLLKNFKAAGIPVVGIEPSRNTAEAAIANHGIPTEVVFFGTVEARRIAAKYGQADLIAGNNVLAHVPDINDFVGGVPQLLKPEGVLTFEFPHLGNLIRLNQFDTIYHEHFSYLSLHAVERVFARAGLRVFDVQELPTHGGSLRVFGCHLNAAHQRTGAVDTLLAGETAQGLTDTATYAGYQAQVDATKRAFLGFLIEARNRGARIAGYGAAAKGNTMLNYAGVRADFMDFVADRNPQKQGRFLPGTHIPIVTPDEITRQRPDYVVILPWNLREEIASDLSFIRDWGGQFVVAVPELEVF